MSGVDEGAELEPLVQPRLIRFLKDRPRLVDKGVRRELLEQLENQAIQRRRPDTAAEKAVQSFFNRFNEAGGQVARERAKKRMRKANEGPLKGL